ncbi:kinase-like protein [Basidiobolus meristosporus CBS 931.73]|uniref:non-specific serine/threonine protein kinase n=1 Tax=Basidiobolus meristosporus CBS 931.73 TaxID=1314790 RepID=A0A1Y1YTG8_9FUNG|nr:kinase-like protein [Basidiobolus meristosporus CBS 931.73]|eukprot:ORY01027.1 kinase-like protein [Basidiobolus meristosporus CBS 931.73]
MHETPQQLSSSTDSKQPAEDQEERCLPKESPTVSSAQEESPEPTTKLKATSSSASRKRTPKDFSFGRVLGEGSYSTVYSAMEYNTGREFAVKVLDKRHIIKEKKVKYVTIEKSTLSKLHHPFIVRLHFTFQDNSSLYYVLDYAQNGELLSYIRKLGSFDEKCTRFYAAEIITAMEYIHSQGIIHRDLKPENILLDHKMHIKLTDFGTAKMVDDPPEAASDELMEGRASSFVGTAEYVSPELLTDKEVSKSADFWALGCILYQLLAGRPPFKGANEYQTFQKIIKLEYSFPVGFPKTAQDLVERLLVADPQQRLGCDSDGIQKLKKHPFFEGIDWNDLHKQEAPKLVPYLPPNPEHNAEELRSTEPDYTHPPTQPSLTEQDPFQEPRASIDQANDPDRAQKLEAQRKSKWSPFLLESELIVRCGKLTKRRGLFSKKRVLLLTDFPRLIYINEEKMTQAGEIAWSKRLLPEYKNKKHFFVHTPNKTHYFEDPTGNAQQWVESISQLMKQSYDHSHA